MDIIKDVKRAIKGNVSSFENLIQTNKLTMYRVARTILSSEEDCADAIQEAILKAYKNIHSLKKPAFFKTWLIRILINECYQIHRHRKKIIPFDEYQEPISLDQGYFKIEIDQLLDLLPEEQKQLIKLFHIEDLSIQELALIYEAPENTIKTKLRRAREKLRMILIEKGEFETWTNGNNN
ncbi:sigma-70 family RNA polymerase sigma factor [Bacillus sp. CGMCC 1.16607]|uniref:sigma-70 family RNA polymerase sigma factor n=1 Tax=Bacillus sp. CGMCC 1.16607 TaxID=3351842 RepID=UPI0036274223